MTKISDSLYEATSARSLYNYLETHKNPEEETPRDYEHTYEDGHNSMISMVRNLHDYYDLDPKSKMRVLNRLSAGYVKNYDSASGLLNGEEEDIPQDFAENPDFETFFKKIIASVYLDGVESIDPVPSNENNFLWDSKKEEFIGQFSDGERFFTFRIYEKASTEWGISYKLIQDDSTN